MTWMVAAQFAPVPPRRKRGGLPAGCSAIVLVCALVSAPAALGASQPAPDPMPHVHPDAAPVKQNPARAPTQPPKSEEPAATKPNVQQPASTRQPARPAITTQPAAATSSAAVRQTAAPKADRAKDRRARRRDAAHSRPAAHPPARPSRDVVVAARGLAQTLAFATPQTSDRSPDDGPLFAGAALLLLVAAAGSLLRLGARMSGDTFRGRPG